MEEAANGKKMQNIQKNPPGESERKIKQLNISLYFAEKRTISLKCGQKLCFSTGIAFLQYIFTNFYVFTKISMYGDEEKRYL